MAFKTAENWTPICLPKFNNTGFLHAHVRRRKKSDGLDAEAR